MIHAVRTGLSVIDASAAMEGNGPCGGTLVDMGLIIAGTSPLATDMVGASLMGFEYNDVPAIVLAHETGMLPVSLNDIDIVGLSIDRSRRHFKKPDIVEWNYINKSWGVKEL
jgi:uncharacterized protein (DUF362 family)